LRRACRILNSNSLNMQKVKVEQARGVGQKLCMRNNSDSFENDLH
jgi:hypothetical protein